MRNSLAECESMHVGKEVYLDARAEMRRGHLRALLVECNALQGKVAGSEEGSGGAGGAGDCCSCGAT